MEMIRPLRQDAKFFSINYFPKNSIDDMNTKKDAWKDEFSMYYQREMNSGDFIRLKFTAENGQYYSNFRSKDFEIE